MAVTSGAADARAQQATPVAVDPAVAHQGTALLVEADASLLSSNGQAAESITIALPRGMRVDALARLDLRQQRRHDAAVDGRGRAREAPLLRARQHAGDVHGHADRRLGVAAQDRHQLVS